MVGCDAHSRGLYFSVQNRETGQQDVQDYEVHMATVFACLRGPHGYEVCMATLFEGYDVRGLRSAHGYDVRGLRCSRATMYEVRRATRVAGEVS